MIPVAVVTPPVAVSVVTTPQVVITATVGLQGPPGAGMPETIVDLGTVSGTQELDLSQGSIFIAAATGNCAWTVTNPQPGITGITLELTNGGLIGQTFFSADSVPCEWPGKRMPALTPVGKDELEFFSRSNWATMTGGVSRRDVG